MICANKYKVYTSNCEIYVYALILQDEKSSDKKKSKFSIMKSKVCCTLNSTHSYLSTTLKFLMAANKAEVFLADKVMGTSKGRKH